MSDFKLQNFCMAFVDLLGQRDAMKGEGLLPQFQSVEEEERFKGKISDSVGQILRLQKNASHFIKDRPELSIRNQLEGEEIEIYDESKRLKVKQQRWSDGLVLYTTMRGKTPMNAIFEIFCTVGGLCLIGLGERNPIRGGIDIAWGAELHEGEVYGPVVANSYGYETLAQYPRIVVGDRVVEYLNLAIRDCDANDKAELINKKLAELCLKMVCCDIDGYFIINYLGETFTQACTKGNSSVMFNKAYEFANEQYYKYQQLKDTKLAVRYNWLLAYFEVYKDFHT